MKTNATDIITDCNLEGNNCGLTKREYFAAMAMQGMMATSHTDKFSMVDIAEISVTMAYCLIEALNK